MSKLFWDQTAEHLYETGVDHVVVYPANESGAYPLGVAWNGVTGWTESPSGADETALYADNIKYLSLRSAEEFGATITAYTYPDEFAKLDGSISPIAGVKLYQQARRSFGLCVRTLIGNDVNSNDHGYMLHLVYGLTASPSERGYSTVNDSPEAIEFSWELKSVPVSVSGYKATSVLTIDSTKFVTEPQREKLALLKKKLYGSDGTVSYEEKTGLTPTSYSAVAEPGSVNPSEQVPFWYERSGEEGNYTYTKTNDESVVLEKTYYTKNAGDDPSAVDGGLYERSGEEGSYTYTKTVDTEVNTSKTYYKQISTEGTDPYLPLPEEVISTLTVTAAG